MPRSRIPVYLVMALLCAVVSLGAATSVPWKDGLYGRTRQPVNAAALYQALRDHGHVKISWPEGSTKIWARRVEGRRALDVVWKDYDENDRCTYIRHGREVEFRDGPNLVVWMRQGSFCTDGISGYFEERFWEGLQPEGAFIETPP